ncbi:MAG: hypothetical protein RL701_1197 [Pseudomonadota bacterium]
MGRPSKRGELLEVGVSILHRRGYAQASVESITDAAGVPKGSFFNHFGSKEAFAVQALQQYYLRWQAKSAPIVADASLGTTEKLRRLLAIVTEAGRDHAYSYGCLVGNLAAELTCESAEVRQEISVIFEKWGQPFEAVIRAGQEAGELTATLPPAHAARFIVNALQGALLRAKVDHSAAPLEELTEIVNLVVVLSGEAKAISKTKPKAATKRKSPQRV